uniref:Sushi domain-containing protein n=1 Tax=Junco hyemalis TaxID=40217 RepID=A0A8C5JR39_JUNHY
LGPAAERVPLRHGRDLQLQARAAPARGALHPLHHPRREPYRNQTLFPEGSRVEFECQPGYSQLLGVSPAITCLSNQTWSAVLEFCKSTSCKCWKPAVGGWAAFCVSPALRVSLPALWGHPWGMTRLRADGGWHSLPEKQCPNPGNPENGRAVVLTDLLLGSKINYTSLHNPVPNADPPLSLVLPTGVTCAAPPAIPNGTHSGGSRATFSLGDVVTYTCASGLALAGGSSLSCTSGDGERGTWSGTVPRCQGTARGVPAASSGWPWHKGQPGAGPAPMGTQLTQPILCIHSSASILCQAHPGSGKPATLQDCMA